MERKDLLTANECSEYYNVEISFISSLHEYGLINMTTIEKESFIHHDQLNELEKFGRLHYDLNINIEGLEALDHVLKNMKAMHEELIVLQNRLKFYEAGNS
jgi:chaperone modulatory protein CbpM